MPLRLFPCGIRLALASCMMHAAPRTDVSPATDHADVEGYYHEIAPFYDAELWDRDDLDFWQAQAARVRGGRVLELGAGSGAVTARLARMARQVVAIDLSADLLQLARSRLGGTLGVSLLRADMRDLVLRQRFDLIVAANDPFSHMVEDADRDRALAVVARHLAPGGRFVLDALWLAPADARAVASVGGRVQRRTALLDGRPIGIVERWRREPGTRRRCHAEYEYRPADRPPVVADFEARDWSRAELTERLARAGLAIEETWGSFQGEPWDATASGRLIVAAGLM